MYREKLKVEIRNLRKVFRSPFSRKHTTALGSLNLDINDNEIFGYIGPSGSGKTTTIKLLMGIQIPTSGTAWILGKKIPDPSIKFLSGYLPEKLGLYNHMTGMNYLVFIGKLYGMTKTKAIDRAKTLLERLGLDKLKDKKIAKYSIGLKQRVGLAQSLINDPEVLLLDEPMTGLDPLEVKNLKEYLLELKDDGKTIFYSSPLFHDVESICDRIGILSEGRLVEVGRVNELLRTRISPIEIAVEGLNIEGFKKIYVLTKRTIKQEKYYRFFFTDFNDAQKALKIINDNKATLRSYIPHPLSLEEYFISRSYI